MCWFNEESIVKPEKTQLAEKALGSWSLALPSTLFLLPAYIRALGNPCTSTASFSFHMVVIVWILMSSQAGNGIASKPDDLADVVTQYRGLSFR